MLSHQSWRWLILFWNLPLPHRKCHGAVVHLLHKCLQIRDQPLHQEPGMLGDLRQPGLRSLRRCTGSQPSLLLVAAHSAALQSHQVPPQTLLLCHRAQFQRHRTRQVSSEDMIDVKMLTNLGTLLMKKVLIKFLSKDNQSLHLKWQKRALCPWGLEWCFVCAPLSSAVITTDFEICVWKWPVCTPHQLYRI